MSRAAAQLIAAGMSAGEAGRKGALFVEMTARLPKDAPTRTWFVPGRIEVLGKHTDYAGGRSLLCATERGMCVAAQPRHDAVVRVTDIRNGQTVEFPISADLSLPAGWGNYVGTVVRRLARNFPSAGRGADIALRSDLPSASGLSSSSVLVVAIFTALAEINELRGSRAFAHALPSPEQLAEYLGCVENGKNYRDLPGDRGVGTFGGSEDHTAILCSEPRKLACYRFCPVTLEQRVPLPENWSFVIGSSGVRASKTGGARDAYNRASLAAACALETWLKASGRTDMSLATAVRSATDAPERIREVLKESHAVGFSAEELQLRLEQFVLESEVLTPAAVRALENEDARALGEIVDRSQSAAEHLLGNQVRETIALASSARQLGAIAASAFGAGFGGSVWALVERPDAERFLASWRADYVRQFPENAARSEFFFTGAGPAITEINL